MKNEEILSSRKARLGSFQTLEKGRNLYERPWKSESGRWQGEKNGFEKKGEAVCQAKEHG